MTIWVVSLAMQGEIQKKPTESGIQVRRQKHLPVVDFDAQQTSDFKILRQRQAKSRRYDRQSSEVIKEVQGVYKRVLTNHWSSHLSALPCAESDVVLIGGVVDAQAFLSNDQTGVYSEFNVQVEEVLKKNKKSELYPGSTVWLERYGGAVRFPSGAIQRYETSGQGMPLVGQRYLFFLKNIDNADFTIVTGYGLDGQTVWPLDGSVVEEGNEAYPFDKYQGFEVPTFLKIVRSEIRAKVTPRNLQLKTKAQ